jgi:fructokinase
MKMKLITQTCLKLLYLACFSNRNPNLMYKIGIALGGTKVEAIVIDNDENEIFRKRMSNGKEKGYENVLQIIKSLYQDCVAKINQANHTLGLGLPGAFDKETEVMKNCANIPCLVGKDFRTDLEKTLGHKIKIENDANCFALAEAVIGAGRGHDLVFGVILGTGCGGGLVYKGEVIKGLNDSFGEWGHSTLNYVNGPEWAGGIRGAVEAYISGSGVESRYSEKFNEELSMSDIVYNYRNNGERATEIMDSFFEHFAIAMSNLIKFYDPEVIVIGGGLSNVDEIYTEGLSRVHTYNLNKELYTPIVKNKFGDSAGVFGAALVGIQ